MVHVRERYISQGQASFKGDSIDPYVMLIRRLPATVLHACSCDHGS